MFQSVFLQTSSLWPEKVGCKAGGASGLIVGLGTQKQTPLRAGGELEEANGFLESRREKCLLFLLNYEKRHLKIKEKGK